MKDKKAPGYGKGKASKATPKMGSKATSGMKKMGKKK